MRTLWTMLLLAGAPALGQDAPPAPPPPDLRVDVPASPAQEVQLRGINFAPGQALGLHVHPGTELAYVVSGTIRFRLGNESFVKHAGDSTLIPRGVPHAATNIGSDTARVVSAFVVDKGAQLRVPVGEDGKAIPQ